SNNDVNVLRQSPVLNDLKVGKAPEVPFVANDVTIKRIYLTNGIYPEWAVLMKSISQPGSNDVKRIRYKQAHKAARKDVERAFGVLKKKWAIVRTPARSRSLKRITHLMYTCIILHNMIRKEKGKAISPDFYPEEQHREDDLVTLLDNFFDKIRLCLGSRCSDIKFRVVEVGAESEFFFNMCHFEELVKGCLFNPISFGIKLKDIDDETKFDNDENITQNWSVLKTTL
ncbi:ALP1-like protein, partial [Tanacetum coccineum]